MASHRKHFWVSREQEFVLTGLLSKDQPVVARVYRPNGPEERVAGPPVEMQSF
jgi:hypothetical protein